MRESARRVCVQNIAFAVKINQLFTAAHREKFRHERLGRPAFNQRSKARIGSYVIALVSFTRDYFGSHDAHIAQRRLNDNHSHAA